MKKITFLFVSILLVSVRSYAHVELGEYQGVTRDGAACTLQVTSVSFQDGVKDPLAERIEIQTSTEKFILQHLPQINIAESQVAFDHDHLTGVLLSAEKRSAAILTIDHTEGHEGPSQLDVVVQGKSDAVQSVSTACTNLKHIEK